MPARHAALALAIALPGCLFDVLDRHDEPERDGSECDHDDGCKSGACRGGICTASSCNVDGDCEHGFSCAMAPSWAEVLSLGLAKGVCLPGCEVCPYLENPRWSCGGTLCSYDAEPQLTVGGPYEGIVGDPITLTAVAELDDGRELASVSWSYQGVVISTELAAELVPDVPGTLSVALTVTDDANGYAYLEVPVLACVERDGACLAADQCCAGLVCDDSGRCR